MTPEAITSIPTSEMCQARGPFSEAALTALSGAFSEGSVDLFDTAVRVLAMTEDIWRSEDLQLGLFLLYSSHYGSLAYLDAELEWDTRLIAARDLVERAFEAQLRQIVSVPPLPQALAADVSAALFALTADDGGPSVPKYIARQGTVEEVREFLVQRSIYTLREADPHSWAIPRLTGAPKAALVEIQSDEYGGGNPDRVHSELFGQAIEAAGLDRRYGAYLDLVPAVTLASQNAMSMFGLNRRLLGAIVGHLAAFEMTSSIPNRHVGNGLRRLGFGEKVTDYFDEHVEADAVHEQIAGRDLAGKLAEGQPELLSDIMFGAAVCVAVDGALGDHMLSAWASKSSSLRKEPGA